MSREERECQVTCLVSDDDDDSFSGGENRSLANNKGVSNQSLSSNAAAAIAAGLPPPDSKIGWFTVAGSFLVQMVVYGLISSFPIFIDALKKDPTLGNPTEEQVSLVNSLASGPGIIMGALGGFAVDKVGIRPVVIVATIGTAFALLVAPTVATSYVGLIGSFSLTFTCSVGVAGGPVGAAVGTWFERDRELALGIAVAGGGVGSGMVPLLSGHLIGKYGWRSTWRILASLDIFMLLATLMMTTRPLPENFKDEEDDDDDENESRIGNNNSSSIARVTNKRIQGVPAASYDDDLISSTPKIDATTYNKKNKRNSVAGGGEGTGNINDEDDSELPFAKRVIRRVLTRNFLAIFFSSMFFGAAYTSVLYVAIPLATSFGQPGTIYENYEPISVSSASNMFTGFGIANAVGAVVLGVSGKYLEAKRIFILCSALATLGILGLVMSESLAELSVAFCWCGGVFAGNWALLPAMVSERFNGPMLGTIMGLAYVGTGVGALFGSPVIASLLTSQGSWYPPLAVLALFTSVFGVIACFIPSVPRLADVVEERRG